MLTIDELIKNIKIHREEWRQIRNLRLLLKAELLSSGMTDAQVRKNKEYRLLKKKQKSLSKRLIHKEKELIRRINENRNH